MLMRTVDVIGPLSSEALWLVVSGVSGTAAADRDAAPQTLTLSSQAMLALSQSARVRGWATISVTVCAPSASGTGPAARDAAPQTLALSSQAIPALSQSARVRGWATISVAVCAPSASGTDSAAKDAAPQTLALSSQAMPALPQSPRVKGWGTTSSASTSCAKRLPISRTLNATSLMCSSPQERPSPSGICGRLRMPVKRDKVVNFGTGVLVRAPGGRASIPSLRLWPFRLLRLTLVVSLRRSCHLGVVGRDDDLVRAAGHLCIVLGDLCQLSLGRWRACRAWEYRQASQPSLVSCRHPFGATPIRGRSTTDVHRVRAHVPKPGADACSASCYRCLDE